MAGIAKRATHSSDAAGAQVPADRAMLLRTHIPVIILPTQTLAFGCQFIDELTPKGLRCSQSSSKSGEIQISPTMRSAWKMLGANSCGWLTSKITAHE